MQLEYFGVRIEFDRWETVSKVTLMHDALNQGIDIDWDDLNPALQSELNYEIKMALQNDPMTEEDLNER